jgi:hypothetical protein
MVSPEDPDFAPVILAGGALPDKGRPDKMSIPLYAGCRIRRLGRHFMRKFLLIVAAFLALSGMAVADDGLPGPSGPIPRIASK